jgi:uncharacterized membrane protein YbhN (UPF0104 family)
VLAAGMPRPAFGYQESQLPSQTVRTPPAPGLRRAAIGLGLLSALYLAVLLWTDTRSSNYASVSRLAPWFPALMAMACASWGLRYLRWHWLLRRAGHEVAFAGGLPAYLAGFAFTATPGKLGELLRVRYFAWQGVPAARVTSAFVFERAVDLVTLLLLALPAASGLPGFGIAAVFVTSVIALVGLLAWRPAGLSQVAIGLRRRGLFRAARAVRVLRDGLRGSRIWMRPVDVLVSLALGLVAWTFIAATTAFLLWPLGFALPVWQWLPIYPLAMLTGAASMLPGGLGSTEAAMTAMLAIHGMPASAALMVAVSVRLCTMWSSIVCGFGCVVALERRQARQTRSGNVS